MLLNKKKSNSPQNNIIHKYLRYKKPDICYLIMVVSGVFNFNKNQSINNQIKYQGFILSYSFIIITLQKNVLSYV